MNKLLKGHIEFVGPVCESSDKFLVKKKFSKVKEGDYIGLANVGAYGMSLSSNYNTRPTIAEIIVRKKIFDIKCVDNWRNQNS